MPDNILKEIAETAKLNPQNYYLKFKLQGIEKSFVYRVTKKESDRIERCFEGLRLADTGEVFEFQDLSGRMINVKPDYVVLCHVLWDMGQLEDEQPPVYDLTLFIEGIKEPQEYDDIDNDTLVTLASILQAGSEPFINFIDQDGERVFIRTDKVMLMESVEYTFPTEEDDESAS